MVLVQLWVKDRLVLDQLAKIYLNLYRIKTWSTVLFTRKYRKL